VGEGGVGEDRQKCDYVLIHLKFDLNIAAVCRVHRLAFIE